MGLCSNDRVVDGIFFHARVFYAYRIGKQWNTLSSSDSLLGNFFIIFLSLFGIVLVFHYVISDSIRCWYATAFGQ